RKMDSKDFLSKSVALLFINQSDENDMHVYLGKIERDGLQYYFKNESKGWNLSLTDEQITRMEHVTSDLKKIFLDADFVIPLWMGDIADEEIGKAIATGMKWH